MVQLPAVRGLKRPAEDTILPVRAPKQQRTSEDSFPYNSMSGVQYLVETVQGAVQGAFRTLRQVWNSSEPTSPNVHQPNDSAETSVRQWQGRPIIHSKLSRHPLPPPSTSDSQQPPRTREELPPNAVSDAGEDSHSSTSNTRLRPPSFTSGDATILATVTHPARPPTLNETVLVSSLQPPARISTEIINLVSEDEDSLDARNAFSPSTSQSTIHAENNDHAANIRPRSREVTGEKKGQLRKAGEVHSHPLPGRQSILRAKAWRPLDVVLAEKKQSGSSFQPNERASTSRTDLTSNSSRGSLVSQLKTASTFPTSEFTFELRQKPASSASSYSNVNPKLSPNGKKLRASIPNSKRLGYRKPRFDRPHILSPQHKVKVAESHEILREQLKVIYAKHKAGGYKGTKEQFNDFIDYTSAVHGVIRGDDDKEYEKWLLHYLDKYRKTREAPLPLPFIPTLDQLNKRIRAKDEEIEKGRLKPALPESLPPEDDAAVTQLLRTRGIVSKCAREQVSDQDLKRLNPGQWLNDEIINFYGAMLNQRAEDPKAKVKRGDLVKAYYFSTFFWTKLAKDGYEKGRLAKWTKKVDIFSKDIILIPVNHNNSHWTAAAINFRRKRFESYDSLNMADQTICDILRKYVDAEHMNKKKKPFDFNGWVDMVAEDHPQQENGYDCGVFTCQTLESLSRGEESRIFTQANMPYLRRRMIWEIGNARLRDDV